MVRVLTDDHHPDLVKIAMIESVENFPPRGVHRTSGVLFAYKLRQGPEVFFVEFIIQPSLPARRNSYVHRRSYAMDKMPRFYGNSGEFSFETARRPDKKRDFRGSGDHSMLRVSKFKKINMYGRKGTEITQGMKVTVVTEYQPSDSSPSQYHYVFPYRITIENPSEYTIQLQGRHWLISD